MHGVSGLGMKLVQRKKWACVRRRRLWFFYAYATGRFYWLLFAIVIHALLNLLLIGVFLMMRLRVYVAEFRMFNLRNCIRDRISQFTKTLGSFVVTLSLISNS